MGTSRFSDEKKSPVERSTPRQVSRGRGWGVESVRGAGPSRDVKKMSENLSMGGWTKTVAWTG